MSAADLGRDVLVSESRWTFDGKSYKVTKFSDVLTREGFGWELSEVSGEPNEAVLEAFWDDSTGLFTPTALGEHDRPLVGAKIRDRAFTSRETGLRTAGRDTVAVGSLTTGVAESPRKKSGRRCRIGAEAFVAGVSGRPRGAPPIHRR
jgi:hypothetical protein